MLTRLELLNMGKNYSSARGITVLHVEITILHVELKKFNKCCNPAREARAEGNLAPGRENRISNGKAYSEPCYE